MGIHPREPKYATFCDPSNFELVKESVRLLLRGCGYKSGCSNKRCSCFKAGLKCGAGCRCVNCQNFLSTQSQSSIPGNNKVEEEELQSDCSLRERDSSDWWMI